MRLKTKICPSQFPIQQKMKIGFITCADLSRYRTPLYTATTHPLLTHDDQWAFDYLQKERGCSVEPVIWGASVDDIVRDKFDCLIVRSPWDYMDDEKSSKRFFDWLLELERKLVCVLNSVGICLWSLDKHYLFELERCGVRIVPSRLLEADDGVELVRSEFERLQAIVVKPCIGAAAKVSFVICLAMSLNIK